MKLFENIKSGIEKISVDSLKDKVEAIKDTVPKKNKKEEKKYETPAPKKEEIPEGCIKCPSCGNIMEKRALGKLRICPKCAKLFRMNAKDRIKYIVDKDSFEEFDVNMESKNPLNFPDYISKVKSLQEKTGLKDAVKTGKCTIGGRPCVIAVMDSGFMMGSLGSVVGEKITRAFEYATNNKMAIIVFTCSGGARMQEGIISLMQMSKVSAAVAKHSQAGLLYITVLTDPTYGGVTASYAMLGDIILSEPKAAVGFAGRRVIEGTIKQKLPDEFQTSEFLLEHGFVDAIVEREKLPGVLKRILKLHNVKKVGEE